MSEKTIGGVMGAALFVFLSWFLALPMLGVSYDTPTGIVAIVNNTLNKGSLLFPYFNPINKT